MKSKISQTVSKYSLINRDDKILIALSGGADSVFLTEYLLSVKDELNLTLEAAHIEHGIRGQESINDMQFCIDYCKRNGIKLHLLGINAVNEAKIQGVSVEEYSRNRRYDFFSSIECDKIATAHNATDNAETLIFRLARGSSLKGLCSIPPRRDKIIRPLIETSAADIRSYLDSVGVSYCVDSTNISSDYTRNYIRNEILPKLESINPEFVASASKAIELLNTDENYLESVAKSELENARAEGGLSIEYLRSLPEAIVGRIIAEYLISQGLPYDYFKVSEIKALINNPSRFQITSSYSAVSNKRILRIVNLNEKTADFKLEFKVISSDEYSQICKSQTKAFDFYCDNDKIIGEVIVRSRRAGDLISPAGRGCTKSLKKLYNELEIPFEKRDSVPVITDGAGIIGICGYCVDERVRIDGNTKNILTANIQTEDNK